MPNKTVLILVAVVLGALLVCGGCGVSSYNRLVSLDQAVRAQWAQVENVYQRRLDLVPNLVETVKGAAKFEQETLTKVVEARSKATQATSTAANAPSDPAALQRFQAAQDQLGSALSRLLVVVERYPELKSDANFRDLQAQLEGTENRITVARNRYIESVQEYNVTVRRFPSNLTAKMFGYDTKPTFTVENETEIARPPQVSFER